MLPSLAWVTGLIPPGAVGAALQSKLRTALAPVTALNHATLLLIVIAVGSLVASRRTIVPIETLRWSSSRAFRNMRRWARTTTMAGLDHGTYLGVAVGLGVYLGRFDLSGVASPWQRAGMVAGSAEGVLAAATLALIKPSLWFESTKRLAIGPRLVDALAGGVVCAIVIGAAVFWWTGLVTGLGVFALLAFSAASNDPFRALVLGSLIAGLASAAVIGALSWPLAASSVPVFVWLTVWVAGGLHVGMFAGLAVGLAIRLGRWWAWRGGTAAANVDQGRTRAAVIGVASGVALGLAAVLLARTGFGQRIRDVAVLLVWMQDGFVTSFAYSLLGASGMALGAAVPSGTLGALGGALSGATGADVERRLVPNQGIRQSAANIVLFAALGTLIIGVPYGLFNLMVATLTMRVLPTWGDWLRLGVGPGLGFGLLAGLLPGAACIQHSVLRIVLWLSGALPLRYARFLDFATRRRLLQRVGGRYRFIHVSLRDHLEGSHSLALAE